MLDTGATNSVVGEQWINSFYSGSVRPTVSKSSRTFRFGDSRIFTSLGCAKLKLPIAAKDASDNTITMWVHIDTDVIRADIPLLLSQKSLKALDCSIDFRNSLMTLNGSKARIMLDQQEGNHLSLPVLKKKLGEKHEPDCILVTESAVGPKNMSEVELLRLHRNLAHASPGSLFRVLKAAHYFNTEAQIKTVVDSRGCTQQNVHTQPPLIKEHLPEFAGHTVCSDIFYPLGEDAQKNPYALFVCALSRFTVAKPLKSITPKEVTACFLTNWVSYFGRCHVFLSDRGPGYTGSVWEDFADAYAIVHVTVPVQASHSNGLVERQVSLIKEGFKCARERDTSSSNAKLVERVVLARNLVPSIATNIPPMMAMCGRSDLFTSMEQTPQFDASETPHNHRESEMIAAQRNITELFAIRNLLIGIEAAKIVKVSNNRRCRANAWNIPNAGDAVDIYRPSSKKWEGNFRYCAKIASHGIVEKNRRLFRHPLCWVRKKWSSQIIEISNENNAMSGPGSTPKDMPSETGIDNLRETASGSQKQEASSAPIALPQRNIPTTDSVREQRRIENDMRAAKAGNDADDRVLVLQSGWQSLESKVMCTLDAFEDTAWECKSNVLVFRRNPQWRADVFTVSQQLSLVEKRQRKSERERRKCRYNSRTG